MSSRYDIRIGSTTATAYPPADGDTSCPRSLEAPLFFTGELLTAQDLDAIVRYTRGRLALDRYRDGWGVVCGLGVGLDPGCSRRVVVGCGYAVGPQGNDILVPAPAPFVGPICPLLLP